MPPLRYYFDEHMPKAVARALRLRGVDVVTLSEIDMLSAQDHEHLARADAESRVIVSCDADFLCLDAQGHQHGGIIWVKDRPRVGYLVRRLMMYHEHLDPEDMRGAVEFL